MRAKFVLENKLFEGLEEHPVLSIEEFIAKINVQKGPGDWGLAPNFPEISNDKIRMIVEWWNENRSNIHIRCFNFNTYEPILGVFLEGDNVLINEALPAPPEIKLFTAAHESRHVDQHRKGEFNPFYFDPVKADDFNLFKEGYERLEKDANDYGLNAMNAMGIRLPMPEVMLRGNERASSEVFKMMQRDIEKFKADDMFDLYKAQIF